MNKGIKKCPICELKNTFLFSKHNQYEVLSLYSCNNCGYYFTIPHRSYFPSDFMACDEQNKQNSLWWIKGAEKAYNDWRNEENNRIINIVQEKCELKKVFEIGFGEGPLTEKLLEIAPEYWGIEPESTYFESTCERLNIKKDKAFPIGIEDIPSENFFKEEAQSFDTVLMASVFEHLPDPRSILSTISKLLKPGGRLFLSTPDSENFKLFYYLRKIM
ncbi:MAG: class I SAM-dependent methyltransferase, partial [Desulfobacula sp.]|nr:class I SAM-dependent methyltransferase [Desulfobacula sp.]